MSAHLPECLTHQERGGWCICPALRACEARTLSAARDAVEALPISGGFTTPEGRFEEVLKSDALAAIDALKGDQA